MEQRSIGPLRVSVVGLGCNNFGMRCDEAQTRAVVHAALDEGITFFDTADIYGGTRSEEYLGRALAGVRDDVVIATKFGMQVGDDPAHSGGSARWVAQAAEDSLRRLGTDRIDLYQYHRPDPSVGIDETLDALDALVRAGKVRAIGNSNFSGGQIRAADETARAREVARFVSAQNQYSLLRREAEDDVLPACEAAGLGFLPYFPLASGVLTGKYVRGEPLPVGTRLASMPIERRAGMLDDATFDRVEALDAWARAHDRSLLDLAIGWLASKPVVVSVIAGATRPEQVRLNVAAAGCRLTPAEMADVDEF